MKMIILVLFVCVFAKASECPFTGVYRSDDYKYQYDRNAWATLIPYLNIDSSCNYESQFINAAMSSETLLRAIGKLRKINNEFIIIPVRCGINQELKCDDMKENKITKNNNGLKYGSLQYYPIDEASVDSVITVMSLGPKNAQTVSRIFTVAMLSIAIGLFVAIAIGESNK